MAPPPVARPVLRNKFTTPNKPQKEETAEDIVSHASILAEANVPTFIPGIRAAVSVYRENLTTIAAIDRWWRVYWNPEGVKFLVRAAEAVSTTHPCAACGATSHNRYAYVAGFWIHEVGHQVFKHAERFDEGMYKHFMKWNIVTDMEMNDDIPTMGKQAQLAADERRKQDPRRGYVAAMCLPKRVGVNTQDYLLWGKLGSKKWSTLTGKNPFRDLFQPVGAPGTTPVPFLMFPDEAPDGRGGHIALPEGKIAETYWDLLPSPTKPEKSDPSEDEGDGGSGDASEGDGDEGDSEPGDGGQGDGEGNGEGNGEGAQGLSRGQQELNDHGSGVDNETREYEDGDPNTPGNELGVGKYEADAVRRNIADRIQKAAAQGRGTVPAGWSVWADKELKPASIPWEVRLQQLMRTGIARVRGCRYTTYRRPSRTSIVNNFSFLKPNVYSVMPEVAVIVDTSGSMGTGVESRLGRALAEADCILRSNKARAKFIDCDAAVYGNAQQIKSVRAARISGGGGTDMTVGIRAAQKSRPRPHIIILFTDGDTPWPTAADMYGWNIITCICTEDPQYYKKCPAYMNPIHVDVVDRKKKR